MWKRKTPPETSWRGGPKALAQLSVRLPVRPMIYYQGREKVHGWLPYGRESECRRGQRDRSGRLGDEAGGTILGKPGHRLFQKLSFAPLALVRPGTAVASAVCPPERA